MSVDGSVTDMAVVVDPAVDPAAEVADLRERRLAGVPALC